MESMRRGLSPTAAAEEALNRITQYYPKFSGALITINITGHYGKTCEHFVCYSVH